MTRLERPGSSRVFTMRFTWARARNTVMSRMSESTDLSGCAKAGARAINSIAVSTQGRLVFMFYCFSCRMHGRGSFHTYHEHFSTARLGRVRYFCPMSDSIHPYPTLRKFANDIFLKIGCPTEAASSAADALLHADLRGIDSHGV